MVETASGRSYNKGVEAIEFIRRERGRHRVSVRNAVEGVKMALKTQPNFAYHTFFSLCAVSLGVFFEIGWIEWLFIIMLIAVGMVVEMANTAFESVVDLVTDVWHKDAKVAKDVAAGMMLIFACFSVLLAGIIFSPYIFRLVDGLYSLPFWR